MKSRRQYRTIGLLLDYMNGFSGGYEEQLRLAFSALSEQIGIELFMFYGRGLEDPAPQAAAHNAIFQLASSGRLDGVIVLSSSLAVHCGPQRLAQLAETLRPLPLCSIGLKLPGIPSVLIEGRHAVAELTEHLITRHGRTEFAFIGGPKGNVESQERLEGLREVLAAHGLPLKDEWVFDAGFNAMQAARAATKLVESAQLPDAIVAASDVMALATIRVLQARGVDVPGSVSVTGFDNLGVAPLSNPPLTTAAQPFEQLARRAIELVLAQLDGREAPQTVTLQAQAVLRRSCGCGFRPHVSTPSSKPTSADSPLDLLRARRTRLNLFLAHTLASSRWDNERQARQLLSALESELGDKPGAFVNRVQVVLQENSADSETCQALQDAIACLRQELRSVATPMLEDTWHDARDVIRRAEASWQGQHRVALDDINWNLLLAAERAAGSLDVEVLASGLLGSLPTLGVQTAFLSHFPNSATHDLHAFLCMRDGEKVELETPVFAPELLLPPEVAQRPGCYMVFPIVYETEVLGLAVYGFTRDAPPVQLVLRDQLAPALRAIRLHEEIVHTTREHERSLGEKIATAKRMESLSALAGGVAHDLNNTLGPMVALPDLLSAQLKGKIPDENLAEQVMADLHTIKTAAMRTAQTVRNLLALGRQGRTRKAPVDLGEVVTSCLDRNPLRQLRGATERIKLIKQLTPAKLTVKGAENQLTRAVENLLRNAIESIDGPGTIRIQTDRVKFDEPHPGYEVVKPGDYVRLVVSDTGCGISSESLSQIFEPFYSTKKAADQSGTGLGLAIVHGVIKEHDGYLDVCSTPGAGTTFTCYLPFERLSLESAPPRSEAPVGRARILVVDDEPAQRLTAERVLKYLGYDVDVVPSELDAIRYFESVRSGETSAYDVVIIDVVLGGGADGLLLREQLQAIAPGFRTILASGHASQTHREHAKTRGLPWLPKPYTMDHLARCVQAELKT